MKKDPIATKQMEEIWDEHHNPEKDKQKRLEKRRKERSEKKKKDYGID